LSAISDQLFGVSTSTLTPDPVADH